MRKLTFFAAVMTAAAVGSPAAFASGSVTRPGLAVSSRACTALRTSVGVDTFVKLYPNLGSCTSQWVGSVDSARLNASAACRLLGRTGSGFAICVGKQMMLIMERRLNGTAPAMRGCAAEVNLLGTKGFASKYAAISLQTAVGQCVFPKTALGVSAASTPAGTYLLPFTVSALSDSGVGGTGLVHVDANGLTFTAALSGAEPGQFHDVVLISSSESCAALAQSIDAGGSVVMNDSDVLISLPPSRQSGRPMPVDLAIPLGLPLAGRQVMVLGMTVNGAYDSAYPVACGSIAG